MLPGSYRLYRILAFGTVDSYALDDCTLCTRGHTLQRESQCPSISGQCGGGSFLCGGPLAVSYVPVADIEEDEDAYVVEDDDAWSTLSEDVSYVPVADIEEDEDAYVVKDEDACSSKDDMLIPPSSSRWTDYGIGCCSVNYISCTVVLDDSGEGELCRPFEFDYVPGNSLAEVFGSRAILMSADGNPVGGNVSIPRSLKHGRLLMIRREKHILFRVMAFGTDPESYDMDNAAECMRGHLLQRERQCRLHADTFCSC
jgi:hypothetical protein